MGYWGIQLNINGEQKPGRSVGDAWETGYRLEPSHWRLLLLSLGAATEPLLRLGEGKCLMASLARRKRENGEARITALLHPLFPSLGNAGTWEVLRSFFNSQKPRLVVCPAHKHWEICDVIYTNTKPTFPEVWVSLRLTPTSNFS